MIPSIQEQQTQQQNNSNNNNNNQLGKVTQKNQLYATIIY